MNLNEAKSNWIFLKNAYEGAGGFKSGEYLVKFPREVDEKYNNRKKGAYYINYTKDVIERYRDYLFKKKATRMTSSELVNLLFDDADLAKNSIDIFMKELFCDTFLYGLSLVIVDMPRSLPGDLKSQKESRAVPYLVKVSPLALYDYKFSNGVFEWIILEYSIEQKEPFGELKTTTEYHYFDAVKFEKRDKEKNIIESYGHNLGACPVLALKFSDELLGETMCCQISAISKRIFNARSELDEILRGQTFSILAYHSPDGEPTPSELKVSVDNVLLYSGNAPAFLSPDQGNSETYIKIIKELENKIDDISLNPVNFSSRSADTGIALKFKAESLNSALQTMAKTLEDFERRAFEIVFKWLNLAYDYTVSYPNDFQIADLRNEIENASALKELGMPLGFEIAKKKELARLSLNGLDDEEMANIYDEIAQSKEI